jgi:integrase
MAAVAWPRFTAEVLSLYAPPMRRPATRRKVGQVLREFTPVCRTTRDLTPPAIAAWLSGHEHRAAATHRSLLAALRAACTYGVARGYMADPFAFRKVRLWLPEDELEPEEPFRRHRRPEEIRRVLDLADREAASGEWDTLRLRALVYALAYTGAGKLELLGLRHHDVDFFRDVITIRSHPQRRLKRRARAAQLPIAPPLSVVLAGWMPQTGCEWVFPHKLRTGYWHHCRAGKKPLDEVRALGERAGVAGLTLLDFRHTVGTLSEGWGIGELALQRILRHARRQTQDHYRHEDLELLRRAAAKIQY